MEHYEFRIHRGRRPAFDEAPAPHRRRVHGVDYIAIRGMRGGDLYFTRAGWAMADSMLPCHWYDDDKFRSVGRALPGATGAVYRVPVPHRVRGSLGVVVKFCRFAQDVGLTVVGDGSDFPWPADLVDRAEFLGPFEEFGRVMKLRERGRSRPVVRTMRPLAIYCPAARFPRWQMGRDDYRFAVHQRALAAGQAENPPGPRVEYDQERLYVMIYQWMGGIDAEEAARVNRLPPEEMQALSRRGAEALAAHGFAVLDHKARHVILRPRRDGSWARDREGIAIALIDYELLVPLPAAEVSTPA